MNLQLTRPLAIIDLESTGLDPVEDRAEFKRLDDLNRAAYPIPAEDGIPF